MNRPHSLDDRAPWRVRVEEWAGREGVPLAAPAVDSLIDYAARVLEWSRTRARLVGRDDPEWLLKEQIVPSLLVLRLAPPDCDGLVDIGAGAGIVGLTCSFVRPDWRVVLVESVRRKYLFLHEAVRALDPARSRLTAVWSRAEEAGTQRELSGAFPLATGRGVGGPEALLPLAAPFLRPGGRVVVVRSSERRGGSLEPSTVGRFRFAATIESAVAAVRADAWELQAESL